jgi:hypothetical protein
MMRPVSATLSIAIFILAGVLSTGVASAQLNRSSITGTVTDSTGSLVPDVEVTATNLATRETAKVMTNGDGIYSILNLFPGTYAVRFSKEGFKAVDLPEITLQSTQVAKIDQALAVGSVSEAVTVTAEAPVLDSETATVGTHLSGQVVTDLPLNIYGGRQIETFAYALTPGYSPLSSPYEAVINGTQGFTKEVTVDGTSSTAQIQGDSMEIGPTMEAIQEVESQTSGIDAQNGSTNGGVIMFNIKSGTNDFHGTSFLYGHNEFLDARVWGNPDKPKSRFWDYGGSVGGPIRRNKTFFFGAFERFQQNDFSLGTLGAGSGAATVPTADFLKGDFSALLDKSQVLGTDPHGQPIYAGAIFNPKDPGAVFPGNVIPSNMISSVSQKIAAIYQQHYAPAGNSLVGNNRFLTSNSPTQTPNQAVVKIDHNLTDKNHLSGSWTYDHRPRLLADSGGVWEAGSTNGGPLASDRFQTVVGNEFRVSDSWTLTPNLLNIFNATYNRYWNGSVPAAAGSFNQDLGFGDTGATNFPAISFGGNVNGYGESGIGNTWQGNYVAGTFLYNDNVSWTKGRHTFMFGGEFRAMQINSHGGSGALSFGFNNNTTGAPGAAYANQVGFGFASFLLGDVQSAQQTTPFDLYGRRKAMDLFAQDSWKVTPKLTVNIGLRWDATFRLHEKYGHWANFDLNAVDPNLGIKGSIIYANSGGDSFEKNEDWHNFGPTIGIAYNPWKRVVLRGSFSILYVPIGIQFWEGIPYGFAPGFRGTNSAGAPFNWDNGYPGVYTPGTKSSTPSDYLFPIVSVDPNALQAGYTDNWNLGVQYQLTNSTMVEASYIGNRGHHLQDSGLNNDQTSAAQFLALNKQGTALNYVCDQSSAASAGVPYPYAGFCAPALAAVAPYPQIAAAEANIWYYPTLYYFGLPRGQSYYDSMVIQLTKRLGRGFSAIANYTLSRQEGDTFSAFGENYGVAGIQDFANTAEAAHTLSPYDQKHVFKGAVSYELPFGKGHRLFSNAGGVANKLINGWRVSGLVMYASGAPLGFSSSNYYWYPLWSTTYVDYNLAGYSGSQFHSGGFQNVSDTNAPPAGNQYFPKTIAKNPAYGEFGTGPTRVDAIRGFGIENENVSLMKNTYLGAEGRYKLQFRVEFYNIFNRHTFINPITDLNSPEFGYVPGVSSTPRAGQFGLRFEF